MVTIIVGTLVIGLLGFMCFGTAKGAMKTDILAKEIHARLELLEDRFYNPGNYEDTFIRPISKKKDNGKEG